MGRGGRSAVSVPDERYHPIALAYARAELALRGVHIEEHDDVLALARMHSIDLYAFKRLENPRVHTSLGLVRALRPRDLLDVGSGRGLLLWPLAAERPDLRLIAVEHHAPSAARLERAFRAAGLDGWRAVVGDAGRLPLGDRSMECVSAFEVLEHIPDHIRALDELWRVADRALLISFPRRPDDCPDHLRYFERRDVDALVARCAGARPSVQADRDRYFVVLTRA